MNILIKLTCLIGLVIAPILGGHTVKKHNGKKVTSSVSSTQRSSNITKNNNLRSNADFKALKQGEYAINSESSLINWTGNKIVGDKQTGTLKIKEGIISYDSKGNIESGKIIIDMTSIKASVKNKDGKKLVAHLSADDFFETSQFPIAVIHIEKSFLEKKKGILNGQLTIKEISQPFESYFRPIKETDKQIIYQGELNFDRTKFGIKFKSGSILSNLGNQAIDDIIKTSYTIVINK